MSAGLILLIILLADMTIGGAIAYNRLYYIEDKFKNPAVKIVKRILCTVFGAIYLTWLICKEIHYKTY